MNEQKRLRWGMIGAGRISAQFARDMQFVHNAELSAVAARDLDNAEAFAEAHQISNYYGGYEALYQDPNIDAIYIATPHSCHLEQSKAALASGKAVLCEKPVTINLEECRELVEFADKGEYFLMEGMWTYFLPAIQKAREWLADGRIGKLTNIKADFAYPQLPYDPKSRVYNRDLAGGCLLEMGIYPVAIAWYFMNRDPLSMQVLAKYAPNGVDDEVNMLFDYGDVTATLATSFRCKYQNGCFLIGEKGYIAIPDFWRAKECHLYELDTKVDHFSDERKGDGFEFQITQASEDILLQKKQSDVMPLASSLKFQQHMDAIKAQFKA